MSLYKTKNRDSFCLNSLLRLASAATLAFGCGVAVLAPVFVSSLFAASGKPDSTPVEINIWYGDKQNAAGLYEAQRWFNLLGTVKSGESEITELRYELNGQPGSPDGGHLNIGPYPNTYSAEIPAGPRRLYRAGDFNIEIHKKDLKQGINRIRVIARNSAGLASERLVQVGYHPDGVAAALPFEIGWADSTGLLQRRVHAVDGRWIQTVDGIRTLETGYDRALALGDMRWTDYEVSFPLRIHGVEPGPRLPASGPHRKGSACVVLRWQGHTDTPMRCSRPRCGWLPQGASFCAVISEQNLLGFELSTPGADNPPQHYGHRPFHPGDSFHVRVAVTSQHDGSQYRARVWRAGSPEPAAWPFRLKSGPGAIGSGALLLVAHHLDVSYGDIHVGPVDDAGSTHTSSSSAVTPD